MSAQIPTSMMNAGAITASLTWALVHCERKPTDLPVRCRQHGPSDCSRGKPSQGQKRDAEMPLASESRLLRSLGRVYRLMLFAYPVKFRNEYSREMALTFRDRARDVVQSNGTLALLPFVLHVIRDWSTTVAHERLDMDSSRTVNRVSAVGLVALSLIALMTVLPLALRAVIGGHVPPPEPDEGTAAHIFQLSIVALVPTGLTFLVTSNWAQPVRSVRRLALPAAMVVVAFSIIFYVEQIYYPAHGYPPPRQGLPLILLRRLLAAL
jgi:hypothetical protein